MGQRRPEMDTPASAPRACKCENQNEVDAPSGDGPPGRCVNSGAPEGAIAPGTEQAHSQARHRQPGFGGTACGSRSTRPTGVR
jgi:hypothetical protein